MQKTKQKNVLVTGGAKRLGAEIAMELAKNGWNVAIHHNNTAPDMVLSDIRKHGVKGVALKADLLNINDVKELVNRAVKELGEITMLVNSASIFERIKFMESDENAYDIHMDIHVKAPYFISQEFALHCKSGGNIINIIDSAVTRRDGKHFAYYLSKKALRNLSKMLAQTLGPNIRVNAIFPGTIEEFSDNADPNWLKTRVEKLPMKKLATSKQVTHAIINLANSSLTGQEVFVDGGEHLS